VNGNSTIISKIVVALDEVSLGMRARFFITGPLLAPACSHTRENEIDVIKRNACFE